MAAFHAALTIQSAKRLFSPEPGSLRGFFLNIFLFDRLVSIGWVQVALYDPHALPEIGLKTVPFAPLNLLPKPVSRLTEIAEKVTKIEKIEK